MKLNDFFPARQKAFDFVKSSIEKGVWKRGERLPSARKLALLANVSLVTMSHAIQLLRENGLVSGDKCKRPWIGPNGAPESPPIDIPPPWQRKKATFEKDLASGFFGLSGKIPSIKELQARYGVGFKTMQKILHALEVDGGLLPQGRGFVLPRGSSGTFRQKILFITSIGHYSQTSAINQEHNRIVNLFENECMRLGLGFDIIEVDFYNSIEVRRLASGLPRNDTVLGYILDVWWYSGEIYRRSYIDMLARLSGTKKPITVLDETGHFEQPIQFTTTPLIQVYTFEGTRAGEQVGRFLFELGHRRVAFISVNPHATWSRDRFDGITGYFSKAGNPHGVQLVADSFEAVMPEVLSAAGLADHEVRRLIAAGRTASQANDLELQWKDSRKKGLLLTAGKQHTNPALFKNLGALSNLLKAGFDNDFLDTMTIAAIKRAGTRMFGMALESLFKRALAYGGTTAWICATDGTAFEALSFLARRGIRVPEDLSIFGFDNTPSTAIEQGLTTFDFNAMGFVNRMLNFILRPPRPRGPYRHSPIEVEGVIMKRATTGKPAT